MKQIIKSILYVVFFTIALNAYSENNTSSKEKINTEDITTTQSLLGSCNINAGGDFDICETVTSFTLYGSIDSNTILNSYTWTQIAGPPLTITNPNSLTTTVTGAISPSTVYQFQLCAYCEDSTIQCDIVIITAWPDVTPAVIMDASNTPISLLDACTNFTVFGNAPGPGELGTWDYTNFNPAYSDAVAGLSYTGNITVGTNCFNQNVNYTISNAGCSSTASLAVTLFRQQNPVSIIVPTNNASVCGNVVTFKGSYPGCGNNITWSILSMPSGAPTPTFNPTNFWQPITFFMSGNYTFQYTVAPSGPCPGGTATVNVFVCLSNLNALGNNEVFYVCDSFPDSINLNSNLDLSFIYDPWIVSPGMPNAEVINNSPIDNQATGVIYNQNIQVYDFSQTAIVGNCTTATPVLQCQSTKHIYYVRYPHFTNGPVVINYFCGGIQGFNPASQITTSNSLNWSPLEHIIPIQVPLGSSIIVNSNYNYNSYFDVQLPGTYVFMLLINEGTPCPDTTFVTVNVSVLQNPSAGTDDTICPDDTVTLVGSLPINQVTGLVDPNANVLWQLAYTNPPGLTYTQLNLPNTQLYNITNLQLGTYTFVYSFSLDTNCLLTDTTIIVVEPCDSIIEPIDTTCCGHWGNQTYFAYNNGVPYLATLNCGATVNYNCPPLFNVFNFQYFCKECCQTSFEASLTNAANATVWTGNSIGTNYTISNLPSLANGTYHLKVYSHCGDNLCDSCTITLIVNCESDTSCCGEWGEIFSTHYVNQPPVPINVLTPCGSTVNWNCAPLLNNYTFNYVCNGGASTSFIGKLVNTSYATLWNGASVGTSWTINGTSSFGALANGTYQLIVYSYCSSHLCDSCIININVDCPPVDSNCCGVWKTNYHSVYSGTVHSMQPLPCGGFHQWNCSPRLNNFMYEYVCDSPCVTSFTGTLHTISNVLVWNGGSAGSVWNINGNAAFSPLANGWYTLKVISYCGGNKCDSCSIRILVECPPVDSNCCGVWKTNYHSVYSGTVHSMQPLPCGGFHQWNCSPRLNNFMYEYVCDSPCVTSFTGTLHTSSNVLVWNGGSAGSVWNINGNAAFSPLANGWYTLKVISYCGGNKCDSCSIRILVECPPVDTCCGGAWGPNSYTYYATPTSLPTSQLFNCGALVNFNCPPLLNNYVFNYACNAPCTTSMIVTLYNPSNTPMSSTNYPTGNAVINGNTLGINVNGTYRLVAYAYCNGLLCDSCVLNIRRTCPDTPPCCGGGMGAKFIHVLCNTNKFTNFTII